ncbi:MFS family permease [Amycolatopsis bartoniae]|uniref:MFS transporter n=1 Tax=Amycolatopsis bartoniae TaxID=941986 RepID=A0A8H9M5P0_9PSEU|nr:MFS transporter [Amycolatopsis bartoniae]MBB2933286.1 MFS family permease [Amycolatopsis bartoniae]TVT08103.1 MFS transporter [Amycolatopsis bartoniae]GHF58406.1 MFS transporter [Amycolatopsis bartoniae]
MTDTDLPAALAEPVTRVRPGWTSLLFLANIGLWLGIYAPIQVLLPEQAELLDAADKELVFGIVTGVGAVVSLFANPLVGLASDRTRSRFGRRHPWTLLGALVGAAGLVVLALAANVFVMTVGWCVVQAGLNGMLATLTSAVPDRVPVEQRAQIGGLVGISQMLGTVLGAVLVTVLVTSLPGGYVACAGLVVLGAAVFVLRTPDLALPRGWRPAHGWREVLAELWVSPRAHPDFAWAWSCHFLINLGNALGTFFLLFFLKDAVHYPDPDTGLLIMMGLYGAALVVGGLTVGWLSDRSGRRKPYVWLSVLVMAAAAFTLTIWQTWPAALAASPLLGVGFGAYWAVALAILTQVLPAAQDRAKDLGVINIANLLPQVIAPLLATVILSNLGGYPALFAAAGVATLAAGAAVARVKSVK